MSMVTASLILGGVGAASTAVGGFMSLNAAKNAKKDAAAQQAAIDKILANRGDVPDFGAGLTNPYANLQVATGAAEMQYESADMSLANTLDALRSSGGGAGVATALAQQALASRGQISATIEQQEAANQRMRAEGQANLERMQAQAKQNQFQFQENRINADLDRASNLQDRYLAEQNAYKGQALGSLSSFGGSLMEVGAGFAMKP